MKPIAITPTDKKGSIAFKVVESGGIPANIDGAGGGGSITSATLKTADVAEPVEFVFEDGLIWCEMPQQVAEGSPVYLTFTNGALSIVID